MYRVYFDHIHSHFLPPMPLHVILVFNNPPTESNWSCLWADAYRTTCWNIANTVQASSLKKINCLSPSSYFNSSSGRSGALLALPSMTGLLLCVSCYGNNCFCKFMCTVVLSCPENTASSQFSLTSGVYNLSVSLPRSLPSFGEKEAENSLCFLIMSISFMIQFLTWHCILL